MVQNQQISRKEKPKVLEEKKPHIFQEVHEGLETPASCAYCHCLLSKSRRYQESQGNLQGFGQRRKWYNYDRGAQNRSWSQRRLSNTDRTFKGC